jgi:hypothetical protein
MGTVCFIEELRHRALLQTLAASLFPAGLVYVLDRCLSDRCHRFPMGRRQRSVHFPLQVGHRAKRDGGLEHRLADFFHSSLVDAVTTAKLRQHGGQPWPDAG